jgi:hypothetical protein
MQFINPIEILGLSNFEVASEIDNESIKKAKRKLFADIELSENESLEYHGINLSKSECEKAIDQLGTNDFKEFYLYLTTNEKLNNYLISGEDLIFKRFKQDSIFKVPEFIEFISPFFAPKFDKSLLSAFENEDEQLVKSILKTSFLFTQSQINIAYKSLSKIIQERLSEIKKIREEIRDEVSLYDDDDIVEVLYLVQEYFPVDLINLLPVYFQSQILKIATEINYMSVAIWDNLNNPQVCTDLLEHILNLNIESLDKPTFQKNYDLISAKNNERKKQEQNAPTIGVYATFLIEANIKTKELRKKSLTPADLNEWVYLNLSIQELNILSDEFEEIKSQVALTLRGMAVEVWNSFTNVNIALNLINKANDIRGLKIETLTNIQNVKKQLDDIKSKSENTKRVNQSNSSSKDNSGCGWLIFLLLFVSVVIVISNSNNTSSNNYTPPIDSLAVDSAAAETSDINAIPTASEFRGNQLENGESPLDDCFGAGDYSGNATLTIENGGSTDAIVCLYNIDEDRTIRNEYVRVNSNFKMTNIPQGNYKIRVFYGNDWNPNIRNNCGSNGNFESDASISEFDGDQFFQDNSEGFSTNTITLHSVTGGNAQTSNLDQSQFFRK